MTIYNGIDINSNNNVSDWNKVKNAGIQIVINKATEGTYYQDKYLKYRYDTIKSLGIKMGVYCFCTNKGDIITELDYFLNYIKGMSFDTILFLDIEQPPTSYSWRWDKQSAINYLKKAIPYLQSKGYKVGIYTGVAFYNNFLKDNIPNVALWLASYGIQPSLYPNNASWQYTENGTVAGIDGNCDRNYFIDNVFTGETKLASNINNTNIIEKSKTFVGNRCSELQQKLNKVGYKLVVDNIFGVNTYNALIDFQKKNNLIVDGLAGDKVFLKLNELIEKIISQTIPKYNESVPTGSNIFNIPNTKCYIEQATDGRLIIHFDRGNYIAIGKGFIDGYVNDNNGHGDHKRIVG